MSELRRMDTPIRRVIIAGGGNIGMGKSLRDQGCHLLKA
jgi:hypothetical protein